ncbi:MAG: cell division protein FtsA [Candidatus Contendobacter odensis]|uniref:Cell division protein FtsA n=1 Tax=Candidatus Contendibacter odensensis TaxID=1400860 RepID=A0A2G6PFY2_9GAMM|nr:MAG: cell division protein FtsA [Candidatus Contendobacter odensis]
MAKKEDKGLIVSLDIGTAKVVVMVGEINDDGTIEVVGIGAQPSHGLKKGVVVNLELTVRSIQSALQKAEEMAGCRIHSVYTGISGSHIRSFNSDGVTAIKNNEVTINDVNRVIEAARVVAIPADQRILQILPQEFIVDGQGGIQDPIGMSGVRLEVRVHIVTGAASAAQNIIKCVQRCGLEVDDIIPQTLASSRAILNQDEKELGVCLLDLGGGTSDLAVFSESAITHTAVIPVAGGQVTSDIASVFRTSTQSAEEIKIEHACCLKQLARPDEHIEANSLQDRGGQAFSHYDLSEVVESRYEELFEFVREELQRSGFESMVAAGMVLTGGAARVDGIVELAEGILHMPVRLGLPQDVTGLQDVMRNPAYATAVGLLLCGNETQLGHQAVTGPIIHSKGLWSHIKNLFKGYV